ncbi:hypothetical protein KC726_01695 [Candidatus Woesebacteria bacterium]|nr:hypothetical protein [Candidatus Woesebacteria bacterium]
MASETTIVSWLASLLLVLQRFVRLIIAPYKTARTIVQERDITQSIIILALVLVYIIWAHHIRPYATSPYIIFLLTVFQLGVKSSYFYVFFRFASQEKVSYKAFFVGYTYTLLPTLMWFMLNSLLFVLIPPPRRFSLPGTWFSIVYIAIGTALFFWKVIMEYLITRFSSKARLSRVVYSWILFVMLFLPYMYVLYQLKIIRLPII